MKKIFEKETPAYRSDEPVTPYQKARQEWDHRIGETELQTKNWRFAAILSMLISLLLLIMLMVSLSMENTKVFVAQVTSTGNVVNVAPLIKGYTPTQAQEEYFVAHFIQLIRSLPLDPVVAKQNWLNAYAFLNQKSSAELNQFFKDNDPVSSLGKRTVTIKITDINAMSDQSYHVDWTETSVNMDGQVESQKNYSGLFTLVIKEPATQEAILQNPLGIYIVDFHISPQETAS